ncbi:MULTISPECIES: HlyC/CorC family transporter [Acidithiobacillus]|jgi:magnesium and cobalt transporter|uniref:Magnesium and cobalt efflux protein CorC n=3 Tax=Acidithiobacillus TaxID=119977 RepID=A0A179BJB1_ACIFR|nr:MULTISPECIES: transporter associated domain-containing protein [Acidithiobacillus]MBU2829398.1 CBS domain-containing protein [Acidithiobacillus ferriphilus]MBU2833532.1 CBS domain-containing protein [Acidithiobacillus ferriphilus]MBU2846024.1 CBS domain-containing protein [Acidithiobacillus ferriphilus]MBU2848107.1 CBS domain-containing protein [Acidithiobacillus ferriphilus]MBU2855216.1 CBS domain-containing protein [Acidithiobacillus ferriphilus]
MSDDRSSQERPRGWWERFTQSLRGNVEDQDTLLELVREAGERQIIDAEAARMVDGIFRMGELTVRDVMIPRPQMEVIELDMPLAEIVARVSEVGHSRFPVVGNDRDDVRGILLAKDLLRGCRGDMPTPRLTELLRPATFIPESKHLDHLLYEFRTGRHHMAVVVDEYGGVAGLITIEDVLEIIVGEIEDEYDIDEDVMIAPREDGDFLVNALIPLEEFNAHFVAHLADGHADTLGGWVATRLGHVPRMGEVIEEGNLRLEVLRADRKRVQILRVTPPPPPRSAFLPETAPQESA